MLIGGELVSQVDNGKPSDAKEPSGRKISDLIAESIIERIFAENLRPGDRLTKESEMVTEYRVGRATVREALRVLEAQGIIEMKVGARGGPIVARPDARRLARILSLTLRLSNVSIREVFSSRLIIEPALASQAAMNRTEDQLEKLKENTLELSKAPRTSERFLKLNQEFHTLLADASFSRPLESLWSALSTIADGHEAGVQYSSRALGQVVAAHRKILSAVENQDRELAESAMTDHLQAAEDYIQRYYPHLLDRPVTVISELD
jgi:GntR family transcriptional repressor for pyruvate dehydrogenase complex